MRYPESLAKLVKNLLTALTVMAAATACGGGGEPSPSASAVEQGQRIYGRVCATCHGQDAKGMPSLGKGLRGNAFTRSLSDSELVAFLKAGRSAGDPLNETGIDMPPRGGDPTITDDELDALVAFLRTL
ncbi:MAG: cytochrome c [Thermoanaerobaculia bacterium]